MQFKVPFSGVGAKYTEHEKQLVLAAMDSEITFTQGSELLNFEKKFSEFIGIKHSYATSSAAGALELTAMCLDLQEGDEVICPAHTYAATAYPFAKHGAKLVWCDIHPETWVIDYDNIVKHVSSRTKAIIVVHLYGLPVDMHKIIKFAKSRGIVVIEDCAQAIGAKLSGRVVGSFGDLSIFSFQSHKNISTLGEGGMLCTNRDDFAQVIPGLRHNGHAPFNGRNPKYYWKPAMVNIDQDIPGVWPVNFCLGEVQAALGAAMIDRVYDIIQSRRQRFYLFSNSINDIDGITVQKIPDDCESAFHLLPVKLNPLNFDRDKVIETLAYEFGVQAVVQYYPLNRYPLFVKNGLGEANIPNSDALFDNMVSLPFHHWMLENDFEYMICSFKDTLKKCLKII